MTNFSSTSSIGVFTGTAGIAGLVQVMGENACGCGGSKAVYVIHLGNPGGGTAPRAANSNNQQTYKIYPNPSNYIVNIALADENNVPVTTSKITATLYDLNNKEMSSVQIQNHIAFINVSSLRKGIYILKINIDGKIESHQVAVE